MDLLTFMQLVPTTEQNLCVQYIKDGFRKIQVVSDENIKTYNVDLVSGQSEYSFPSDFVSFRDLLINTDNVTDYYDYIASIEGREIVVKKYNSEENLDDPDESITDALTLVYTSKDGVFENTTVTASDDLLVRDEVIDALLEYVRWQLLPINNVAMRSVYERKFYAKANEIDFIRSNQFSVVPKPYLRSLRVNINESPLGA